MRGGKIGVVLAALIVAVSVSSCSESTPPKQNMGEGPIQTGTSIQSPYVVPKNSNISWGMVTLQSPDERSFTLTGARIITKDTEANLQPAYALEGPRNIGAVQWLPYPPKDPDFGQTPQPLPASISSKDSNFPTEVFVGIKVQSEPVFVEGIEIQYTDGQETWTDTVPHELLLCTEGTITKCEKLLTQLSPKN